MDELTLEIPKIEYLDELGKSASFVIQLKWQDERLQWNLKDYPRETIMLPASKIWVPNLRVYQYSSLVDEIDYSNEDAKINYKEYGSFKQIGVIQTKTDHSQNFEQ